MIKSFVLATFLITANCLYKIAQDYGFITSLPQLAIVSCIAFTALAGITKMLTRPKEKIIIREQKEQNN